MKRVCYGSLVTLAASFLCQNVCCTKSATVKVSATVEPMISISLENKSNSKSVVFNKENVSHIIKYDVTSNTEEANVDIESANTPNKSFSSSTDTECKLVHNQDEHVHLVYKVKNVYDGQKEGTLSLKMDNWDSVTAGKISGDYADTITLKIREGSSRQGAGGMGNEAQPAGWA